MKAVSLATFALFLALGVCAQSPDTKGAFQTTSIVLYNRMDEFEARSPTAVILASFIKQLGEKAGPLCSSDTAAAGKSGFIAIAIRPDGTMKLWVDVEGQFQPEVTASLQREMATVGVPQVKNGPIAFAVHFDLWGGGASKPNPEGDGVRIPQVWQKAADAQDAPLVVPDDILPLVWKAAPPPRKKETPLFVPEGYELQELKPIGGKILRPRGWFYTEGHREHAYMWTISKEEPAKGGYETGVRIQCFVGVQEATGRSPKNVIQSFLDGKRKSASVISQRPETTQGLFSRVGLETKESIGEKQEPYRILYSCFWGNGVDMAVVVISGTTADLWETYSGVFDAMSGFELIDMTKLGTEEP